MTLAVALGCARPAPVAPPAPVQVRALDSLAAARRYFDLRDLLVSLPGEGGDATLYHRGIVANRFNTGAQSIALLEAFVGSSAAGADLDKLIEAYATIADSYVKMSHYGQAADAYRSLIARAGARLDSATRSSAEAGLALWSALRGAPPQHVTVRQDATLGSFANEIARYNVVARVDSAAAVLVLDSGAGITVLSSSLAARAGVRPLGVPMDVSTITGANVRGYAALVPRISLGPVVATNVVAIVVDDAALTIQRPPARIDGIIGFPVLAATGTMTFTRGGRVEVGRAATGADTGGARLAMQGMAPLVEVRTDGRTAMMHLDTGAQLTLFYPPFINAHADLIRRAKRRTTSLDAPGSRRDFSSLVIDSLTIDLGGAAARLAPAYVLLRAPNTQSSYADGNLGCDLLTQFERVTIDFREMRLRVH